MMIKLVGVHAGGLLIALAFGSAALAAVDESQAKQDWQQLETLVTQYQQQFLSHYDIEKRGQAYVDEWKAWKKKFERFMSDFRQRYGKDLEDVVTTFESLPRPLDVQQDIRSLFRTATDIDIAATEKSLADGAASLGRQAYSRWKNFDPEATKVELKLEYAKRALSSFRLAKELTPRATTTNSSNRPSKRSKRPSPNGNRRCAK